MKAWNIVLLAMLALGSSIIGYDVGQSRGYDAGLIDGKAAGRIDAVQRFRLDTTAVMQPDGDSVAVSLRLRAVDVDTGCPDRDKWKRFYCGNDVQFITGGTSYSAVDSLKCPYCGAGCIRRQVDGKSSIRCSECGEVLTTEGEVWDAVVRQFHYRYGRQRCRE